jgi:hypothetical protein
MIRKSIATGGVAILLLAQTWSLLAATTPDSDFAARCAAPGVVKCVGFDNTTTDIVRGHNLWPDGNGTYRAGMDTTMKASGAGSLRFDLPPPPHAGANIAGKWLPETNDGLGKLFGQNSVFYVQFRQRFSPEMLKQTWDSYYKTVLFHYNQESCAGLELTTINYWLTNLATMYSDCGARLMTTTLDGSSYTSNTPLLLQQGDYKCQYGAESPATCFYLVANEWLTFYYKIQVGTFDQPNSVIEAWVAREGATAYKEWTRVPNFTIGCNTDPCTQSPGKDQGFNNLMFTPYMTALSTTSGLAGVTSHVWYDELIVSTQPIAVPGAPATPADTLAPGAPTGLRAQ